MSRFLAQAPGWLATMTAAAGALDAEGVVVEAGRFAEAARKAHAAPLAGQVAEVAAAARHREYEYAQALISDLAASLEELTDAWQQAVG